MLSKKSILILAVFLLNFSPCLAEMVDRIVAVVNNEVITLSELEEVIDTRRTFGRPMAELEMQNARREALDGLIDDILLKNAVEEAKIEITDDDLGRAVATVLQQNKISPEQLKADIARQGISYETYKSQLAEHIKMIKFINQMIRSQIKLTDRELRDYYDRNKDVFGKESGGYDAVKDKVYEALFEEKTQEVLSNYLFMQRKKAYIDIRL